MLAWVIIGIVYLLIAIGFFIYFLTQGGSDYVKGISLIVLAFVLSILWPLYIVFKSYIKLCYKHE